MFSLMWLCLFVPIVYVMCTLVYSLLLPYVYIFFYLYIKEKATRREFKLFLLVKSG